MKNVLATADTSILEQFLDPVEEFLRLPRTSEEVREFRYRYRDKFLPQIVAYQVANIDAVANDDDITVFHAYTARLPETTFQAEDPFIAILDKEWRKKPDEWVGLGQTL